MFRGYDWAPVCSRCGSDQPHEVDPFAVDDDPDRPTLICPEDLDYLLREIEASQDDEPEVGDELEELARQEDLEYERRAGR